MNAPAATPPPACLVRPPWPDELPRLADAFPRARFNRAIHPLVLVAPDSPERLVGFAGVLAPVEGSAGLTMSLRPHFVDTSEADHLVAAALLLAADLGATRIRTADDLPPGSPVSRALLRGGFVVESAKEIWEIPAETLARRLDQVRARLAAAGKLAQFTVGPLDPAQIQEVTALLAAANQLSPERRQNLDRLAATHAYAPGLCAVVRRRGAPVAVTLLRGHQHTAIVETLALAPAGPRLRRLAAILALDHSAHACRTAALATVAFATDIPRQDPGARLARRCAGRPAGTIEILFK